MIIQYTSVTDTREINLDLLLLINNRLKTVFVVRVCNIVIEWQTIVKYINLYYIGNETLWTIFGGIVVK